VTLVFVGSSGEPIGALAPFDVATPLSAYRIFQWWPDVAPVVARARNLHGVEVTVLRLIHAQPDPTDPSGMSGSVTYAVETAKQPPDLLPWSGSITEVPKRAAWARPGGPASDLAWADAMLHSLRRRRSGGDVPGANRFGAPLDLMLEMVAFLVKLQTTWMDRLSELLSLGLPDWRADQLGPALIWCLVAVTRSSSRSDARSIA
jgi:hypothetical protein